MVKMTEEQKVDLYNKYILMVQKRAHDCAKKFNYDYEEAEAQALYIFWRCVEMYDVSKKVSFSTYLYTWLNSICDYIKHDIKNQGISFEKYITGHDSNIDIFEDDKFTLEAPNYDNPTIIDFLKTSKELLSVEAFYVLRWIVNRDWENEFSKVSRSAISKKFKYSYNKTKEIWEEIKIFWNSYGVEFYA